MGFMKQTRMVFISLIMLIAFTSVNPAPTLAQVNQYIRRISVASDGTQGNYESRDPAINADGSIIAFESWASNLVMGDTNGDLDVFVHNLATSQTTRVSVNDGGVQGNGISASPSLSDDGRYVAFSSEASNFVAGDYEEGGREYDIYIYDRQLQTIKRVNADNSGTGGNEDSLAPWLSADGSAVAFSSHASNLVPNDTNGDIDIFYADLLSGLITRVTAGGVEAVYPPYGGIGDPVLSADGRKIFFASDAENLVPNDNNHATDVFLYNLDNDAIVRVSLGNNGEQADDNSFQVAMDRSNRFVVFGSAATTIIPDNPQYAFHLLRRDLQLGQNSLVNVADDGTPGYFAYEPSMSADSRFIVFSSDASNLAPGDTNNASDIFLRDLVTQKTVRLSFNAEGIEGNSHSFQPRISADGRFVTFTSQASNLVTDDTNNVTDVFVVDLQQLPPTPVELVNNGSFEPLVAADGIMAPWKLKNAMGDKVKCNKPNKQITYSARCAFKFKGSEGENSKLTQKVTEFGALNLESNSTVYLQVKVRAGAPASGQIKAVIAYNDDTKTTLQLDLTSTSTLWDVRVTEGVLTSSDIKVAKIKIKHTSASGKVYIDDVSLYVRAPHSSSLIPLPHQ
jgi:Tol biopolymer transport system component